MVHRVLVGAAVLMCGLVVCSFALFARDQLAGASQHQVIELNTTNPVHVNSSSAPRHQPRRFIDGAAHDLTSPFTSIVSSNNTWVEHAVPTGLALLVYGVGLGFLARYSRGWA